MCINNWVVADREPQPSQALQGLSCLVTRPSAAAQGLLENINRLGGQAIHLPAFEIVPITNFTVLDEAIASQQGIDLNIFVSQHAARAVLARLTQLTASLTGELAAVGPVTAACLQACSQPVLLPASSDFTTEGLLQLPRLQTVEGQRIRVFRGDRGRETLKDVLQQRGARVEYVSCYQRIAPSDKTVAKAVQQLMQAKRAIALFYSLLSAQQTMARLPNACQQFLEQATWVVPSERIKQVLVAQYKKSRIVVAVSACDEDMLQALLGSYKANP